jgi:beta-mannosidase
MAGIRFLHEISNGWKWRLANSNGNSQAEGISSLKQWTPVRAFPSVIHSELLANKIIPDLKVGENERLVQWVGHVDWAYSTSFPTPGNLKNYSSVDLFFEGLDTFAGVTLNGKEILKSENMFLPQRVDVRDALKPFGQENELLIVFESTVKRGDELGAKYGHRKGTMRDKRRMHIRKAQVSSLLLGGWRPN